MSKRDFDPIHPGEILLIDFLKHLNITQYALAKETMKLSMRHLFILSISLLLSACNSGDADDGNDSPSLKDIDLSGTWKSVTESRTINKSTGESSSSSFFESTLLLEETDNGVLFSDCHNYGDGGSLGIKTDSHFYTDPALDGYTLQRDGALLQKTSGVNVFFPDFIQESTNTLSKISEDIELDSGTLVLNGPVSVEEYSHVCLFHYTKNMGVSKDIGLSVQYGTSYLNLWLNIEGDIAAGVYQYEDSHSTDSAVHLAVTSGSTVFWDITGSNILHARNATINISVSTDDRITGTFEFIGEEDDGSYNGEFEIFFY